MTCQSCRTENKAGAKFCHGCGASLSAICPSCGAPYEEGHAFCEECGAELVASQAAPPQPAAPEPVAERRLVSVLFADLVGFTTRSEEQDPEEVRELLSRYFDAARQVIERYGGTVEKFIGDAVMAAWGTPVAQEDDAERAVRAALDLVAAVPELDVRLQARAGVLTGEAAVTVGAEGQGMVAGDLVNTASRVQAAAEPGSVLVGEATRRTTEAAIAYADAGQHELKGKAEPAQLWHALRVTAGRGGLMRTKGLEPPFVGRSRELRLVKDLFHACTDERQAHLVQVTGIAGIGKSRLGWEFFKYMDGLEKTFFWHRGRCLAYGEGVTYWALAEMVRGRADILEGEDRASALAKLRETVETYVIDPAERAFVEPRLSHLLGLEERTASEKSDLFAGWRMFFERLAEEDPVLMVLEDLQWADPSLLEFIDYLLEWSRAYPIFVMTLARPDTEGDALAASRRNATSIYLEPLPAEAMEQLLTGLVPGLPEQLRRQILARAEGVPLYAVETVRMLLDRGLLLQEGPVYRPTGEVEALEVPETLHALIAARLDGLAPEERRLVQDAAVLGKTFPPPGLAAVSGMPEAELEPLLASLVAKELLSIQADPRSPERGQYGFLQDLVRTVAYETLSKRDRKQRHLAAATYLEGSWAVEDDEIAEVVAAHYVDAYRLAPEAEDADEIGDRARRMLVRAGERAASLAAAAEARAYFQQAAELAESALLRAELLERTGRMALLEGNANISAASFEESTRLFEEAGQTHAAARVQARFAVLDFQRGRLEQALDRSRRAHEVLAGDEPGPDLALAAGQLGRFLAISGRYDEAAPALEEALLLAERLQLPEVYSNALSSKAIVLQRAGRLDEGTTLVRRAIDVALEHDLIEAATRAQNNLSVLWDSLDRNAPLIGLTDEALALVRRSGDRVAELAWLSGSVGTFFYLGRWDEALVRAEEIQATADFDSFEWAIVGLVEIVPLLVHRGEMARARETLDSLSQLGESDNAESRSAHGMAAAEALRAEGKPAQALETAQTVLAALTQLGLTTTYIKRALVQGVEAALDTGDTEQADELLGIVRDAMPGEVTPYLRAHAARLTSRVAALRGEPETVEQGFEAAARVFRELEMPFDLGVALLEHGEWLTAQGRAADAEPLLAEAREIFERLGAKPWLERADTFEVTAEATV